MKYLAFPLAAAMCALAACVTPPPLPTVHVAGDEIHLDALDGAPATGASAQTDRSVARLRAALERHDASLDDLVQLLILLSDQRDEPAVVAALEQAFVGRLPPMTVVETGDLSHPGALVEIEAFAIRGAASRRQRVQFGGPSETVVRVGDRVFVSGVSATDAGPADNENERYFVQSRDALARLKQALAAVGARADHVTRARSFTLDFGFFGDISRAHGAMFGEIRPAAALLPVSSVGAPDDVFLIQANAIVDDDRQLISSGTQWEPMYGYSRAVRAGNNLQVSATAPWLPEGGYADPSDIVAQTRQIFANVKTALDEAGADYADITRLRIFMLDPERVDRVRPVLAEVFGNNPPAVTVIKLQGMADPEVLLEIEMEATIR